MSEPPRKVRKLFPSAQGICLSSDWAYDCVDGRPFNIMNGYVTGNQILATEAQELLEENEDADEPFLTDHQKDRLERIVEKYDGDTSEHNIVHPSMSGIGDDPDFYADVVEGLRNPSSYPKLESFLAKRGVSEALLNDILKAAEAEIDRLQSETENKTKLKQKQMLIKDLGIKYPVKSADSKK